MFYKFNQSKSFRKNEYLFALLSHFALSLIITAFAYPISNIICVNILNLNVDVTGFKYVLIFLILFVLIYTFLVVYYFKLKKGVMLTDDEVVYYLGYLCRSIPVKLFGFYEKIKISDIEKCELQNSFDIAKLKAEQSNCHCIFVGYKPNNISVVKITVNENNCKTVYFLPLENNEEFIAKLNK